MSKKITHKGIVEAVKKHAVIVSIANHSSCTSCQTQHTCVSAKKKKTTIEVSNNVKGNFTVGQEVYITTTQSQELKALAFGYMLPLILLVVALITFIHLTGNEGLGGLIAFASLVPYYGLLYLFRKSFKKTFAFEISEI
jgi:positive regulator of sigma E activity